MNRYDNFSLCWQGFGGMMSFEMHSERESIIFAESTRIFKLAVSLGGAESLIEHVTSMTHCKKFTTDEVSAQEVMSYSRKPVTMNMHAINSTRTFNTDYSMHKFSKCTQILCNVPLSKAIC